MSEPAATPAPAPSNIAEFEIPHLPGKRSVDCAAVPADVRLDFLKNGIRAYVANRINSLAVRHDKDEKVVAWKAYDEATKADPLQGAVPMPDGERPAEPDYEAAFTRAVADLIEGKVRRAGAEPKPRKTKDPLTAVVTDAVIRDVYQSKRALDPKYSYLTAKKEVGVDGIAYLNAQIEAKVAAGVSRDDLNKMLETRYLAPARIMLGLNTPKNASALPSIL